MAGRSTGRWLLRAALALACWCVTAEGTVAAFDQPIAIEKLTLQFGGIPALGRSLRLTAKGVVTLPTSGTDFPQTVGGSVRIELGTTAAVTCDLPGGLFDGRRGWRALGTPPGSHGFKYIDREAPATGACRALILKSGRLKLKMAATGQLPPPLAYPPGNPDLVLSAVLGDATYCGRARAPHARERADRLIRASEQPAPQACPSVTTTTVGGSTTTSTGQPPPCGADSKCVFVTSQVWDGNLGGLAGADQKCALAAANGAPWLHGRVFRAWLSDRATSAASRLTHAGVPYRLTDGTEIAADWTDLVDGALAHAIDRTEYATAVGLPEFVWTGTNADGSIFSPIPPSYLCDDWTYIFWDALVGSAGRADAAWTALSRSPQDQTCDASYHLYCLEQ